VPWQERIMNLEIDITGNIYGNFKAIRFDHKKTADFKSGSKQMYFWEFECLKCAKTYVLNKRSVVVGHKHICDNCFENRTLPEKKYGKLTPICFDHKVARKSVGCYNYFWKFKCDCGKETILDRKHVINGDTMSCGCYKLEVASKSMKKIVTANRADSSPSNRAKVESNKRKNDLPKCVNMSAWRDVKYYQGVVTINKLPIASEYFKNDILSAADFVAQKKVEFGIWSEEKAKAYIDQARQKYV
jgi:hypothetical protein